MSTIQVWEDGIGFVAYAVWNVTGPLAEASIVGDRAHKSPLLPVTPGKRQDAAFAHRVQRPVATTMRRPKTTACAGCVRPLNATDKGRWCARCRYVRAKQQHVLCACGSPVMRYDNRTPAARCSTCIALGRRLKRRSAA